MDGPVDSPLPSQTPQKTNPWIIVFAVFVVVCCLCVGVIGLLFAFGEPILNELDLGALFPALLLSL